jgi:hypothetical protein
MGLPQETVLWLALLALLVVLFALVLRRMSLLIGRTRDLERFQKAAASLDRRFAAVVEPVVARLDEIRRHAGDPAALARELPAASSSLREAANDARALRVPAGLTEGAVTMARELDRAIRATELVEHGLDSLLAVRGNRELEAQTSLKRGALNLRHARDAFGRAVADITAVRPADLATPGASRRLATLPGVGAFATDLGDPEGEPPPDPRM